MHGGIRILCLLVLCVSFSVALWERTNPLIVEDGTVIEPTSDGASLKFIQPSGATLTYSKSEMAAHASPSHGGHTSDKRLVSTGSGWVSAFWSWGTSYSYFSGQWTVPSAPASTRSNVIFFFNSLEGKTPTGSGSDILQPVLQYNNGVAGWTLASWYGYNNAYTESTPYPVNPGDTITGVISLSGGNWNVYGYVNGVLRTTLTIAQAAFNAGDAQNTAQWVLEVYNVVDCSFYPPNDALVLTNIVLQDQGRAVAPGWTVPSTNTNACNAGGYLSGANPVITWQTQGPLGNAPTTLVSQNAISSTAPWPHLRSAGGRYWMVIQSDGNLVVYDDSNNNAPVWNTGGHPNGPFNLVIQNDGNLVIYNGGGAVWNTVTQGRGSAPFYLVMQDDSNLVIYDSNDKPTWSWKSGIIPPPY